MNAIVRIVIGNCPRCGAVLAETNHGETWPLMRCAARAACDWEGPMDALFNMHVFAQVPPTWLAHRAPPCEEGQPGANRRTWMPIPEVAERLAEGRNPVTGY